MIMPTFAPEPRKAEPLEKRLGVHEEFVDIEHEPTGGVVQGFRDCCAAQIRFLPHLDLRRVGGIRHRP